MLTNGCFDLLHAGHLSSLQFAKSLGDILIVAVNTDASVRRLKGKSRPIFPAGMRMEILGALRHVDYVISFGRDNAVEIVRAVRPDIYVKSEEYNLRDIPEGATVLAYGGKVVAAPLVPGISTTAILKQIRETEPTT